MKNENVMLNVTGIISFVGAIVWFLLMLFILASGAIEDLVEFLQWMGIVLPCLAGIYYILITKFGYTLPEDTQKIDMENDLLRKMIQQNEFMNIQSKEISKVDVANDLLRKRLEQNELIEKLKKLDNK